jgi:hypothetical protein
VHSVNALIAEGGLDALLQDAGRYVREQGVELVVLDAVSHLYKMVEDQAAVWRFLSSLGTTLFLLGCTTIVVMSQWCGGKCRGAGDRRRGDPDGVVRGRFTRSAAPAHPEDERERTRGRVAPV